MSDIKTCPVCNNQSYRYDVKNFKCSEGHVWHMCPEHGDVVVTSLVGDCYDIPNTCTCGMDVFKTNNQIAKNFNCDINNNESGIDKDNNNNKIVINIITNNPDNVDINKENFLKEDLCFPNYENDKNISVINPFEYKNNNIDSLELEEYERDKAYLFSNLGIILTASKEKVKKAKNPSPTVPPVNISKAGKEKWKEFCKKYSKIWKQYTDTEQKWAVAVAIWRNYAVKRNIPPFETTTGDEESTKYMANRIVSTRKKSSSVIETFSRLIVNAEFADKILKEVIEEVNIPRSGVFRITTRRKIKTDTDLKKQKFRIWLKSKKFDAKNGKFIRNISGLCNLIIESENNQLYLTTEYTFPAQLVLLALGMDKTMIKDNPEKVLKSLTSFFKKTMKEFK